MFQFDWPWVFAFLPLPFIVYVFLPRVKREDIALRVPFFNRASALYSAKQSLVINAHKTKTGLLVLIWLLLVAATARPQWVGEAITLPASGRDLLLAVDISGSMETPDMIIEDQKIPRVLVVKYVVSDFIKRRESDRIGLILFGTNAYLQAPLTFDKPSVDQLLQEAQLGFAGEKTAIGDAIGLAIKRLRDRPESQRVLILLTDGANTAGEVAPRQAADLAKQAGIKIYTIGMGATEMTVNEGFFGTFQRTINPSSDLDEETLEYISETTGGRYFRARNPQELQEIYGLLDQLEPIEQKGEVLRPAASLYFWPLSLAVLFSFFLALAPFTARLLSSRKMGVAS